MKKIKVVGIIVLIVSVLLGYFYFDNNNNKIINHIPLNKAKDQWWGVGPKVQEDESIQKFKITIDEEIQKELSLKLQNTRYFTPIEEENLWKRGTNPKFMKELIEYWKTEFNWAAQVDYLNSFPNFKTTKRNNPNIKVLPLLLLHGWPGSFYEFYGAIPYLTDPEKSGLDLAFDIVIPSLPGYGFSSASRKPGLTVPAIGLIMGKLMNRLGYPTYLSQGGDYGAFITRTLPLYDKNCVAIHLNLYMVSTPVWGMVQVYLSHLFGPGVFLSPHDHQKWLPFSEKGIQLLTETGYMHLQATKPNSVGHALTDSPVGLAAYIIEKFYVWSDNNGDIYSAFSKDQLLTNVMTIGSAINYYYDIVGDMKFIDLMTKERIDTPTGLADYKAELVGGNPPLSWAKAPFRNIIQYSQLEKGGHFAALEQPEIFSKDVIAFGKIVHATVFNGTSTN